jgi:hypothetical protein
MQALKAQWKRIRIRAGALMIREHMPEARQLINLIAREFLD